MMNRLILRDEPRAEIDSQIRGAKVDDRASKKLF